LWAVRERRKIVSRPKPSVPDADFEEPVESKPVELPPEQNRVRLSGPLEVERLPGPTEASEDESAPREDEGSLLIDPPFTIHEQ